MICTSIGNCSVEKCISSLKGLRLAEVRLDLLSGRVGKDEVRRIFSSHQNLIATCRPGKRSQSECASLLLEAIANGAAYVDIEVDAPAALRKKVVAKAKKKGCKVIVSFHDYKKTPSRQKLEAMARKCFSTGDGIAKIACKANSAGDCARLLSLLDGKRKLAVVGMGKKGRLVRVVAPMLGSAIAYASPAGRQGTADGQMAASELQKAQRMILDGTN
ncbi:MAG: type I 3-dehydroquinate dehydratase [Candidatus Micrarchaeota archaeon]|nr:type I 3-dehydroquinate dehydratase [Candidatus Micrarchaeota archaeon]